MKGKKSTFGLLYYIRFLIVYWERWKLTNITYLFKNIISSTVVFILTCYAVRKDAFEWMEPSKSCIFAVLMALIWSGLFNSIALFYSEANYTIDDMIKVLPIRVYIIANFLIQILLCLAEAIVCLTIFSVMFSYTTRQMVFTNINIDYGITFFLIIFSMDMLGFAIGIFVNKITSIMTVVPIILIIQLLFSGCLFSLSGVLKNISVYTTAKWGYSALGTLSDINGMKSNISKVISQYQAPTSELFGVTKGFVTDCWIHMLFLIFICTAIATVALYFKLNKTE